MKNYKIEKVLESQQGLRGKNKVNTDKKRCVYHCSICNFDDHDDIDCPEARKIFKREIIFCQLCDMQVHKAATCDTC